MESPFSLRRTHNQPANPVEELLKQARQKASLGSMGSAIRHGKFAGTEVLGTEFREIAGTRGWVFAFWSDRDPRVRICFAPRGELPEHITSADRENLQTAKTAWEAYSGVMPN
jgi:hypothetical protein